MGRGPSAPPVHCRSRGRGEGPIGPSCTLLEPRRRGGGLPALPCAPEPEKVTAISMESMLVGKDLNGSAFVYGSLSFLDKVSCGLALYVLESYQSSPSTEGCHDISGCQSVTRYGSGLIPASCALLGAIVTYTMNLHDTTPVSLIEPLLV